MAFIRACVIVIGVAIALAAEQVVERLHEANMAQETRETARGELRVALTDLLNRRATQNCIDRRLDEVTRLLELSGQSRYKPPTWIGRPQYWTLNTSGWDAAAQGGRAALLDAPESKEAPGPDRDGDGDDKGAAAQSATPPGVGNAVDVKA